MLRTLIVDDERLARQKIRMFLEARNDVSVAGEAGTVSEAIALVERERPDLVLLDIQMPGGDGFDVVRALPAVHAPAVVFITAHGDYAIRAFEVAAVDYLLKPFDEARFAAAWTRLVERRTLRTIRDESQRLSRMLAEIGAGGEAPGAGTGGAGLLVPAGGVGAPARWAERLVLKRDQRTYMLPVVQVEWAESNGNYVVLHVGKDRHELRETLTSLEGRLDPARFVRVHRRVIVSVDAIRELQPWFGGDQVLILKDGTRLRVSRSYREHVAQRLEGAP